MYRDVFMAIENSCEFEKANNDFSDAVTALFIPRVGDKAGHSTSPHLARLPDTSGPLPTLVPSSKTYFLICLLIYSHFSIFIWCKCFCAQIIIMLSTSGRSGCKFSSGKTGLS